MDDLAYGRRTGIPKDIKTAWGARLIAPNDLVHDRQDLVAENDEAKSELIAWLNGSPEGTGAIAKMREWLAESYWMFRQDFDQELVLYEDEQGIIVGSTQASYGYVYAAGWLKPLGEHFEIVREPITVERWVDVYGWEREQAEKFNADGPKQTEVRLYHVDADGERRDLAPGEDGQFEFGYGGTGPHTSAQAIVEDLAGDGYDGSPARLRELVPEVFDADFDAKRVVILAANVRERLLRIGSDALTRRTA
jgi:hypothetical protein